MRSLQMRVASPLCRSIHTGATTGRQLGRPGPAHRSFFHRTSAVGLPRRRNFFTSNVLLQQDGSEPTAAPGGSGGASSSRLDQAGGWSSSPPPTPAKRKTRSTGPKNSLRRVAAIAQQQGPGGGARASSSPPSVRRGGSGSGSSNSSRNMIRAVCAAESYDMEAAMHILQAHGFHLDPEGTGFESHEVVHARGTAGQGDLFVFESGTIVAWGLEAEVVERLATRTLLPAAEDPFVERRETEDLEFELDPSRDTSLVRGDVVVLGTRGSSGGSSSSSSSSFSSSFSSSSLAAGGRPDSLDTTLAKIAFSSGLARSTKLAALETSFTSYFESTRRIPPRLSRGARLTLSRRFILQKTGELLSLRAQLNHYRELTDSLPDLFWDSKSELGLEGYYDQVGRALDVGVRIKTLNQKMDYAQEIATVLREIESERHSTRLEWIIILLIAVEVVFELRRVYLERQVEHAGKQQPPPSPPSPVDVPAQQQQQ